MSTVTISMLEYFGLLAIVLVAGICIGWTVERELVKRRRRKEPTVRVQRQHWVT